MTTETLFNESQVAAEFAELIAGTIQTACGQSISDYGVQRLRHELQDWLWLLDRDDRRVVAAFAAAVQP